MNNKLFIGDNLEIMRKLPDESVDLCCTDPPFRSGRSYKSKNGVEFNDRWKSIDEFCGFMRLRLVEMHRILKPTGSIYVHLDQTSSHYIKIEMDRIFGQENFHNEIIWCYSKWSKDTKRFKRSHDNILYYSKTHDHTFNPIYRELSESSKQTREKGYHIHYKANILLVYDATKPKAKELIESGKFNKVNYDKGVDGVLLPDYWTDIPVPGSNSKKRNGYPTQKPLELYQRIIEASSNEGDLVLDPFCGSGTTLDASQSLNRQWIGIDRNPNTIDYIKKRFDEYGLLNPNYEVIHE